MPETGTERIPIYIYPGIHFFPLRIPDENIQVPDPNSKKIQVFSIFRVYKENIQVPDICNLMLTGRKRTYASRASTASKRRRFRRPLRRPRRRYSTKLSRTRGSRRRVSFARKVSKVVNSIAETKLIPISPRNEEAPTAIQTLAIAYKYGMVIGDSTPSGWDSTMKLIGGTRIPLGDTAQDRNGAYVYLKKSHVNFEIDMNQGFEENALHEFRMLVFKRRGTNPPGS